MIVTKSKLTMYPSNLSSLTTSHRARWWLLGRGCGSRFGWLSGRGLLARRSGWLYRAVFVDVEVLAAPFDQVEIAGRRSKFRRPWRKQTRIDTFTGHGRCASERFGCQGWPGW